MSLEPFLSIIVPFHDSAETCGPLLDVLARLDGSDGVELIFVDDGSTDSTPELLRDFASRSSTPVHIAERCRGGPGAARNTGLDHATGKFVWFVDSDDTISLAAVEFARQSGWPDVDLVVWDWDHPRIVQRLAPGLHSTGGTPAPPEVLDPIVCNWFSLSFLRRTRLRFPEYTFYEATPIESFVLPLLLERYLKVDFIAYRANTMSPSITRGSSKLAPHRFDCLHTIPLGMAFVDRAALDDPQRARFEAAFIRSFLWYVVAIPPFPGRAWLRTLRVMRQCRDEATRFRLTANPLNFYPGGRRSRLAARLLWALSAALPSQQGYFKRLRERVWAHPIVWEPPIMADAYRKPNVTPPPRTTGGEGTNLAVVADS